MMILRLKKMRFFCYSFFCVKRERERKCGGLVILESYCVW